MSDGFSGAFFDLRLNLGGRCGIVHDDSELVVVDEEPTCRPLPIRVERHRLDCEVTDMTPNNHADEAEEAACNRRIILGAVLQFRKQKRINKGV